MTIEQTVEIPVSRRLFIDIPPEVPTGKAILTFTTIPANDDRKSNSDELRIKLQNLRGSLAKNAFGALDGVAYQHKVRKEWDN